MSFYYPQGVLSLRVLFEDFSKGSAKLKETYAWNVRAKNLRVNLNSYMEADTFSATIDYKNLPFDPRIIRSCGVSIFMEDKKQIFQSGTRAQDFLVPGRENIIFQGFADTDKIELSSDSRTITLEGRDFTSLLIDREYLGEGYGVADRIDLVIRTLLDQVEATKLTTDARGNKEGLDIELLGVTETDLPRLSDFTGKKGTLDAIKNPRSRRSYWDHIQALVHDAGLIAYVSIDKLVITKPRNLYNRANSKVFVYGRNIADLSFERKLGRQKGFNVRVVCLKEKEVLEARIPEEATEEWSKETGVLRQPVVIPTAKAAGIGNLEQGKTNVDLPDFTAGIFAKPSGEPVVQESKAEPAPYITFKVRDVANKDQLIKIGEKIYEELGRQQIEGRLVTKEMKIFSPEVQEGSKFFEATKFRVGTPIEIRIDHGDLEGLNEILPPAARNKEEDKKAKLSIADRRNKIVQFLISRGYGRSNRQVVEAMADALTQFDTPFFTKAVEFTLDQEQGFEMEIEFINFIEISEELLEGSGNG